MDYFALFIFPDAYKEELFTKLEHKNNFQLTLSTSPPLTKLRYAINYHSHLYL